MIEAVELQDVRIRSPGCTTPVKIGASLEKRGSNGTSTKGSKGPRPAEKRDDAAEEFKRFSPVVIDPEPSDENDIDLASCWCPFTTWSPFAKVRLNDPDDGVGDLDEHCHYYGSCMNCCFCSDHTLETRSQRGRIYDDGGKPCDENKRIVETRVSSATHSKRNVCKRRRKIVRRAILIHDKEYSSPEPMSQRPSMGDGSLVELPKKSKNGPSMIIPSPFTRVAPLFTPPDTNSPPIEEPKPTHPKRSVAAPLLLEEKEEPNVTLKSTFTWASAIRCSTQPVGPWAHRSLPSPPQPKDRRTHLHVISECDLGDTVLLRTPPPAKCLDSPLIAALDVAESLPSISPATALHDFSEDTKTSTTELKQQVSVSQLGEKAGPDVLVKTEAHVPDLHGLQSDCKVVVKEGPAGTHDLSEHAKVATKRPGAAAEPYSVHDDVMRPTRRDKSKSEPHHLREDTRTSVSISRGSSHKLRADRKARTAHHRARTSVHDISEDCQTHTTHRARLASQVAVDPSFWTDQHRLEDDIVVVTRMPVVPHALERDEMTATKLSVSGTDGAPNEDFDNFEEQDMSGVEERCRKSDEEGELDTKTDVEYSTRDGKTEGTLRLGGDLERNGVATPTAAVCGDKENLQEDADDGSNKDSEEEDEASDEGSNDKGSEPSTSLPAKVDADAEVANKTDDLSVKPSTRIHSTPEPLQSPVVNKILEPIRGTQNKAQPAEASSFSFSDDSEFGVALTYPSASPLVAQALAAPALSSASAEPGVSTAQEKPNKRFLRYMFKQSGAESVKAGKARAQMDGQDDGDEWESQRSGESGQSLADGNVDVVDKMIGQWL